MISWHRFYDPETGRYTSADPIGLGGGMNLFAYVEGNPVNYTDPSGLRISILGSDAEKALIQSWLNTIGDCCDPEVRNRLKTLIESINIYTIKFSDNLWRAGQYKRGTTELDSDLMNPNSTSFEYQGPIFGDRPGPFYFGGPDTLAHELLGHGFNEENGKNVKDEQDPTRIENKVRDCLGQARRGGWFDK